LESDSRQAKGGGKRRATRARVGNHRGLIASAPVKRKGTNQDVLPYFVWWGTKGIEGSVAVKNEKTSCDKGSIRRKRKGRIRVVIQKKKIDLSRDFDPRNRGIMEGKIRGGGKDSGGVPPGRMRAPADGGAESGISPIGKTLALGCSVSFRIKERIVAHILGGKKKMVLII